MAKENILVNEKSFSLLGEDDLERLANKEKKGSDSVKGNKENMFLRVNR